MGFNSGFKGLKAKVYRYSCFVFLKIKGFLNLLFHFSDPRHIQWYMEEVGNVLYDHLFSLQCWCPMVPCCSALFVSFLITAVTFIKIIFFVTDWQDHLITVLILQEVEFCECEFH